MLCREQLCVVLDIHYLCWPSTNGNTGGLGTVELQDNVTLNRASYGFIVFSILAPLIVVVIGSLTVLVLVLFNARYALARR